MSPVVSLMLLSFMLLIGFSLTVWAALTLRDGRRGARRANGGAQGPEARREEAPATRKEARSAEPPAPVPARRVERPDATATNDAVRGARAPRKHAPANDELPLRPAAEPERLEPLKPPTRPRAGSDDDPFERFLRERSGSDDLDL